MPVTPRTETERLLWEGLHQDLDTKRTPQQLYPRRVTNHVHRFLNEWESQGVLDTGSTWYGWERMTTYSLNPAYIDRDMRRQALSAQAGSLIIQRADIIRTETEFRERAHAAERALRAEMAHDVTDEAFFDRMEVVSEYEDALQAVINARHWREENDAAEAELRARIADEGFDVEAVWAGHATPMCAVAGSDPDADPLGGDA